LLCNRSFAVFEDAQFCCGSRIHRDECRQAGIENLLWPVQFVIWDSNVPKRLFKIVRGWKVPDPAPGSVYANTEGTNYTKACKIAL
jgi:hypothetical protein